jgi:transposase
MRRLLELPKRPGESELSMPRSRRRPTAAECVELVADYQAGQTIRQLAERLGFHRDTVSAMLERAGVARRYHKRRAVDLDRADKLHAAGLSLTEVAETLGIGRTTLIVARRQQRAGLL